MNLGKKIIAGLLACCAYISTSYADITPDLITNDYGQPDVKVSPDGKHLAIAMVQDGRRTLVVVETKTFKSVGGVNFGEWQDVGNYFWANNKRLVTEILHREEWNPEPKYYGELYAVDYNGRHGEMIYGFRAGQQQTGSIRKTRESIYGWARVISLLPEDKNHILISSTLIPDGSNVLEDRQQRGKIDINDMGRLFSTVHRLNIKNGKLSPSKGRSPAANTSFYANNDGELVYAIGGRTGESKKLFKYNDQDEWEKVTLGSGSKFSPIGFDKNYTQVYFIDNPEGNDACLYQQDLNSGAKSKVNGYCGITKDEIALSSDFQEAYAVKLPGADSQYDVFTEGTSEADFFTAIKDVFAGHEIDITSGSEDGMYWVVRATHPENATGYYLYSGESNQFSKLL